MEEYTINRSYVRTNTWSVTAKVTVKSSDDVDDEDLDWVDALVLDMAAGGLLFLSDIPHATGDVLWFDLLIDPMAPGFYGKIKMKVKGEVKGNRGMRNGLNSYSVEFTEISKGDRIRLDELVRMTNSGYKPDDEPDFLMQR